MHWKKYPTWLKWGLVFLGIDLFIMISLFILSINPSNLEGTGWLYFMIHIPHYIIISFLISPFKNSAFFSSFLFKGPLGGIGLGIFFLLFSFIFGSTIGWIKNYITKKIKEK